LVALTSRPPTPYLTSGDLVRCCAYKKQVKESKESWTDPNRSQ